MAGDGTRTKRTDEEGPAAGDGEGHAMTPRRTSSVRLLVAASLLVAIFIVVPVGQVARTLRKAQPGFVALALVLSLVVGVIEAYKLRLPARRLGLPLTTWQILKVNLAAKFYGLFLPGYLAGGVFRWYRFAGVDKAWSQVLAAVAFHRLIDTAVLVVLGLLFWSVDRPAGTSARIGAVLLGLLGAIVAVHLVLASSRFRDRSDRDRGPASRHWLPALMRERVEGAVRAIVGHYQRFPGLLAPLAGLSLAGHLLGIGSFFCLTMAIDIDLSLAQVGWVRAVVAALVMVPVSVAGLGVREGSLLILLPPLGVAESDAVALSLLIFATGLMIRTLGGLVEVRRLIASGTARRLHE